MIQPKTRKVIFFVKYIYVSHSKLPIKYTTKLKEDLSTSSLSDHSRKGYGPEEAELLSKNTNITKLTLSSNPIGSAGALSLSKNTTITILNLERNYLFNEGAESLSKNTTITKLYLPSNCIGSSGALSLSKNTTI